MPLHDTFIITQYTATTNTDSVTVCALSAWDTERTSIWMLSELAKLEYQTDQNPSEVLNGLECFSTERKYEKLTVTVTLNNSGQCLVRLAASES